MKTIAGILLIGLLLILPLNISRTHELGTRIVISYKIHNHGLVIVNHAKWNTVWVNIPTLKTLMIISLAPSYSDSKLISINVIYPNDNNIFSK
jgi:hypothetical protein